MISFLSKYFRRNRSIVWLTVGGLGAFLSALFALGQLVPRFGPHQYRESRAILDQPALSDAAVTDHESGRLAKVGPPSGSGRALSASTTAGSIGGKAGGRGSLVHDSNTPSADEAALFAALERLERRMAAAIARARESVVALEYTAPDAPAGTRRVATGVVINQRGEALSVRIDQPPVNQAPMAASNLSVIVARDFSGKRHAVHWVAADPETGLTLLRLPPRAVRPIRTASGATNLGSQVFVVGNPFGMGHSVSRGHVAGLDRALELGARQLGGLIQVQAPLYPGDSGAAVVNLQGDWLGLIRSGLAIPGLSSAFGSEVAAGTLAGSDPPSGLSPSLAPTDISLGRPERDTDFGFAIPVQDALWVAAQLRTRGRVDRAYLGVRLGPSSAAGVVAMNDPELPLEPTDNATTGAPASIPTSPDRSLPIADEGAILREVLADTPASQAGLRPGDGIVELDGQPIRSAHDLTDRLDRIPARATVVLGVVRDRGPQRQRLSISLCTASRPEAPRALGPGSPAPVTTTASTGTTSSSSSLYVPPGTAGLRVGATPMSTEPGMPPPQPNELRLILPRAIVERLEKLERRLEKLESFPSRPTESASTSDRQISSARNP
jgi:serine protease Do